MKTAVDNAEEGRDDVVISALGGRGRTYRYRPSNRGAGDDPEQTPKRPSQFGSVVATRLA